MANGKPGAPFGNKNPVKAKPWREALDRAIKKDRGALDRLARRIIKAAEEGDMSAMKEIADRLDGKPQQSVEMTFAASIAEQFERAEQRRRQPVEEQPSERLN